MYSKNGSVAKLFFILSVVGLIMYVLLSFDSIYPPRQNISNSGAISKRFEETSNQIDVSSEDALKYILIWQNSDTHHNFDFGEGQTPFIANKCPTLTCHITVGKDMLEGDYSKFHAIVFNMSDDVFNETQPKLPIKRWPHQKYVFLSMLPAISYPICNTNADNFFNWTWTYKLNSDIVSPFIEVRDKASKIVAPEDYIQWTTDVDVSVTEDVTFMKSNALALIIDDCKANDSNRLLYAKQLKRKLLEQNLVFDIYGCGGKECPRECISVVKSYYFYFAYEASFSEDYVTAEVVKAYNSNAVPIVFGGADYGKFLPEKSYINGLGMSPVKLAAIIHFTISNEEIYRSFFRWKSIYNIQRASIIPGLCQLCADLNNGKKYSAYSNYEFFRKWWYNAPFDDTCDPKEIVIGNDILSLINVTITRGNNSLS